MQAFFWKITNRIMLELENVYNLFMTVKIFLQIKQTQNTKVVQIFHIIIILTVK